ncbi:glycerophosphoryl diester phosphodiesterase [Halohasta litchfieldiae]|uniref:Glycerophosphoryl diester phosphodiesterase n=1 Tax=Halohasta litchfieldiae TaxID=1073996 RepID=A0A1H6R2R2_9EURY|nr:glycerophosphodiester phosphodiesterase [Halohasta litchfieldiae]ATW88702.1 glycerophosphoryl diester phosphodiesterase [Halohasta litchfieldiae]SEI46777.1 glycerophosphoryl diester phosphodiesterase [Halohasta litchfieldiae]
MTSGNPNGGLTTVSGHRTVAEPNVIAHRGFAGIYPENTVAAVEGSVADGRASTVEVDVMPTADGEIVVFHDDDLSRLTNAPDSVSGTNIWELPYDRITGYSVLGTTQSVPLLTDVLAAIPPEFSINIELKNPGCEKLRFAETLDEAALDAATDRWRSFVGSVVDLATDSDHELLVSSFYEGALAAIREIDPSIPIASVFYDSVDTGLELSRRYDVEAIHPPWNMVTGSTLPDAPVSGSFDDVDLVDIAHEEGRQVNAWTVTTWHQAAELQQAGVDGVITDYPGVCTAQRPPADAPSTPQSASE